ncbi:hypothetical protein SteCoe_1803 [Stentor coeruleus]|uniref:Serine/threonine-protein phosphatase 2A 55 kDa regulatory subunit B n=1 Tax=Stentor coeruleus TaxID=5963 RepID=A0A1R2D149_9CILI|nr:hypothetical protein SteCoe_1803 [Stentor coeruleus]
MQDEEKLDTFYTSESKINSIKYSQSGSLLFFGDTNGNLYIKPKNSSQFSSFQCNFDSEIDVPMCYQPINKIEIAKSSDSRAIILTALDKSLESWKIFPQPQSNGCTKLVGKQENSVSGVHECTINSISMCQNMKNFLTSDDLNIFLWDLEKSDSVLHIVDHKETVQPISEVITGAKFHPHNTYEIMWTSTNGSIRLGDMRTKLIMDKPGSVLKYESSKSWYYEELVVSISSAEFCKSHESIVARDYFTVKYWDLRKTNSPYLIADVIEEQNLCMSELYQTQAICAEFEVKDCLGSEYGVTGGYGEVFFIHRPTGEVFKQSFDTNQEILHIDTNDQGDITFAMNESLYTRSLTQDLLH